jgi:hypothetical protein
MKENMTRPVSEKKLQKIEKQKVVPRLETGWIVNYLSPSAPDPIDA